MELWSFDGGSPMSEGNRAAERASSRLGFRWPTVCLLVVMAGMGYAIGHWGNQNSAQNLVGPTEARVVRFEPARIDLGDQLWGRDVAFELGFVNASSVAVTIERMDVSCDCTLIDQELYQGRILQAGEWTTIEGTLDVGLSLGTKTRTVTIRTREGAISTATLDVNVIPTFSVEPNHLDFGEIGAAVPLPTEKVSFRSEHGVHLVEQPVADSDWIKVETTTRSGETTFLVTVLPERLAEGSSFGRVVLTTDDIHVRTYALAVRAVLYPK